MARWRIAAVGIGLAAAMSAPAAEAAPIALHCQLIGPGSATPAGRPVILQFVVRNDGAQPLDVLVWNTPFEGRWFAPFVGVKRDGTELPYGGAKVKRGEPSPGDYLRIEPASSREARIDLAPAFDVSAPGRYQVMPQLSLHDVVVDGPSDIARPRDLHQPMTLPCNPVSFDIER